MAWRLWERHSSVPTSVRRSLVGFAVPVQDPNAERDWWAQGLRFVESDGSEMRASEGRQVITRLPLVVADDFPRLDLDHLPSSGAVVIEDPRIPLPEDVGRLWSEQAGRIVGPSYLASGRIQGWGATGAAHLVTAAMGGWSAGVPTGLEGTFIPVELLHRARAILTPGGPANPLVVLWALAQLRVTWQRLDSSETEIGRVGLDIREAEAARMEADSGLALSWCFPMLTGQRPLPRDPVLRRRVEAVLAGIWQTWVDRPAEAAYLSPISIGDMGGGQRTTKVTAALARAGTRVVFVQDAPARGFSRRVSLPTRPDRVLVIPETLLARGASEFADAVMDRVRTVVVGAPTPRYVRWVRDRRSFLDHVTYDCFDRWDSVLGRRWYREADEQELVRRADTVLATTSELEARLRGWGTPRVLVRPNLVDGVPDNVRQRTPDPRTVVLVGNLQGRWVDWEAVIRLGESVVDTRVELWGPAPPRPPDLPPNVLFMGAVDNVDVPATIARGRVGIAPFVRGPLAAAVSPMKVAEYLACGRPVVTLGLPASRGIPGVIDTDDVEVFVIAVRETLDRAWSGPETRWTGGTWDDLVLDWKRRGLLGRSSDSP